MTVPVPLNQRLAAWAFTVGGGGLFVFGILVPLTSEVASRMAETTILRERLAELAARQTAEPQLTAELDRIKADLIQRGIVPVAEGRPEALCESTVAVYLQAAGLKPRATGVVSASRKDRFVDCSVDVQGSATAPAIPTALQTLRSRPQFSIQRLELTRTEEDASQFHFRLRGSLSLFLERQASP